MRIATVVTMSRHKTNGLIATACAMAILTAAAPGFATEAGSKANPSPLASGNQPAADPAATASTTAAAPHPIPNPPAPVADPPVVSRPREIGLGAIQLGTGYVAELGGLAAMFTVGLSPKGLGIHSDFAALGTVALLGPALAAGAVCGTGLFSRWYRGRCVPTLLGAYAGMAVGALVGIAMAPRPGPDDTSEFVMSVSGIAGALLFAPVGAVVGYHLGKQEIPAPALALAW